MTSAVPDPARPVAHVEKISETIARALTHRIVSGSMRGGDRVGQEEIAAEFSVSQGVVREALRALEARGLLLSLPRRGVRVPPLDRASVRELTIMRASLEPVALRVAIGAPSREWFAQAEQAIVAADGSNDIAEWEAANQRFHLALVKGCGMPRLIRCVEDLHLASARYLYACWEGLAWQAKSQTEHRALLRLIKKGQHEEACTLLREHILAAGTALQAILP